MTIFVLGSLVSALLGWLMGFLSLFLIMLILIQRGKGGGLTGALGGPGGQSAFGSKAGDTFTVITIVIASVWGFTCAFAMWKLGTHAPATAVNETKIKAGPADKDNEANPIVIPSTESTFGPLESNTTGGIGSSTPNVELTPATGDTPDTDTDTDTESADPPADEPATDSEPAADSTEPAADSSTEPAETEPATEPDSAADPDPPAESTETDN